MTFGNTTASIRFRPLMIFMAIEVLPSTANSIVGKSDGSTLHKTKHQESMRDMFVLKYERVIFVLPVSDRHQSIANSAQPHSVASGSDPHGEGEVLWQSEDLSTDDRIHDAGRRQKTRNQPHHDPDIELLDGERHAASADGC